MNQPDLFDKQEGERRKEDGIEQAASRNRRIVAEAKTIAVTLAKASLDGTVTADDVQRILAFRGIRLGNAAGAIFKGKQWRWTGRVVKSSRTTNHARILRVWELVG